jgi:hypothetical protein
MHNKDFLKSNDDAENGDIRKRGANAAPSISVHDGF